MMYTCLDCLISLDLDTDDPLTNVTNFGFQFVARRKLYDMPSDAPVMQIPSVGSINALARRYEHDRKKHDGHVSFAIRFSMRIYEPAWMRIVFILMSDWSSDDEVNSSAVLKKLLALNAGGSLTLSRPNSRKAILPGGRKVSAHIGWLPDGSNPNGGFPMVHITGIDPAFTTVVGNSYESLSQSMKADQNQIILSLSCPTCAIWMHTI